LISRYISATVRRVKREKNKTGKTGKRATGAANRDTVQNTGDNLRGETAKGNWDILKPYSVQLTPFNPLHPLQP
jgi:hypothetical protein